MELVVLGCSGSVAAPGNPASGYLLRTPGSTDLLMDIGPGVLAAMQADDTIDPADCHVALTHIHPDHCLDFPSLMVWRRYHPEHPARRQHQFIGPEIAYTHLSRAGADFPDTPEDFDDSFAIAVHTPGTGIFDTTRYPAQVIDGFTLYSAPAIHPTESYILRIEDAAGRSIVYSGDTGWTDDLPGIAQGADVLVCEATWGRHAGDRPLSMHISGAEAGRAAAQAGVGQLILTHIPPWVEPSEAVAGAAEFYDGPIRCAEPGLRVEW